jgi:cyclomaltodextrin glucanotransferase
MRGRVEHAGNRNYYGVENIALARTHPIRQKLARIAAVRAASPALQRGLQLVLEMAGDRAAFYRVLQVDGQVQTALVLLNKGDSATEFLLGERLQPGRWRSALDASVIEVDGSTEQRFTVAPHDAAVWLLDAPITLPTLRAELDALMAGRERRTTDG